MNLLRAKEWLITLLVFLLVYTVYLASGNSVSSDSRWSIHTAVSLLVEGDTDLDEYRHLITSNDVAYSTETIDGHTYTVYPIGSSIIAAPLVAAIEPIARQVYSIDIVEYVRNTFPQPIELLIASFIVALTAALVYRIARVSLGFSASLALAFVFAFCTTAWSMASRALWQHGPSMLMLTVALYWLLRTRDNPRLVQFASIPLALAYVIRPTNAISVLLMTIYVFTQYRPCFVRYMLWALSIALPFIAYNGSVYHSALPSYYLSFSDFSLATFGEALVGQLLSPSRGLLIFSPVLLLAAAGMALKIRHRQLERLDAFLIGIVSLHWITIATWPVWWGGWSFGPRLGTDMLPYLVYAMIPVFQHAPHWDQAQKVGLAITAAALTGWSLFVHYRGANAVQVLDWNYAPAGVDVYPARVWDWRDAQFLRGVTWGDPIHLAVSGLLPYQVPDPDFFARAGGNDVRTRRFDAAHSLIAPPDDTWIAIATYQTVAKPLAGLFTQTAPSITTHTIAESQPYRLYHFDLGDRLARAAQASEQTAAWSLNFDLSTADIHSARMPVQFGQAIELLGYDLSTDSAQENVTLITYWQVINRVAHPLRLFVHALNPVGQTVAQVDRWDTPPRFWQPGDLIAQISQFTLSLDMRPVWVEMGLYNPDSGDRLPVIVDDREVDHRLLLKQIKAP